MKSSTSVWSFRDVQLPRCETVRSSSCSRAMFFTLRPATIVGCWVTNRTSRYIFSAPTSTREAENVLTIGSPRRLVRSNCS